MRYYAHSLPGRPEAEWQPLELHLHGVAEAASRFAGAFGSADWAWNAGLLHDLGKATNAFQHYLREANEIDDPRYETDDSTRNHASAGAAYAFDRMGAPGKLLAYAIAGHHAGLPDYHTDRTGSAALTVRLEEGRRNLATIEAFAKEQQQHLRGVGKPPAFVGPENLHFWTRMLFSCLIDADRLNTEAFCDAARASERREFPSLESLAPCFFRFLESLERDAPSSDVNRLRAEIRRACESGADRAPGLFSLSVPTGGGKTLSAMAFAVRHAMAHAKRRVIYVIPYTSIIEQTAKVLYGIFGPENVVEHHSNVAPSEDRKNALRAELAAENWDAPIVVTTNVQFFESLYTARPSHARKLHRIVNSVVILDEAQLIPPGLLTPCVDSIRHLVDGFGVTMILATATQPALPGLKPTEIIPASMRLYECLKRTQIEMPQNMSVRTDWPELAGRLQRHPQVLCIVNTRRDCREVFKLMPAGAIHLSALMCGEHRSKVIREIKERLKRGEDCRVISTQLVEAGVDVDFPAVYRALAGLDSVAQAAGRCNREGRLSAQGRLGEVHVFVPPKAAPPGLLRKGEDTMREMPHIDGFDPQDPRFFEKYFALFYGRVIDTGARFRDMLVRDVHPALEMAFRTAGHEFKIIDDSKQQVVFVRWDGNDKWLNQLRAVGPTRENLRALQRSTVSLSKSIFLAKQSDVEEIWPGFWLWIGKYDEITGLDAFGDGFLPEEMIG